MAYTQEQALAFIDHIAPMIQQEAINRGYQICSTIIAQAIVEGAAGTSKLAKNYHNHFGLKCGKAWLNAGKPSISLKTKEEYTPGTLTSISDYFRVYADDQEGVKGYFDFVSSARYSGGSPNYEAGNLRTASNYMDYAERLKLDAYATSSTYVKTLCNTVKKYNLTAYDEAMKHESEYPTLTIGTHNEYVKHVQLYLSLLGYQVGVIDGVYGTQTSTCVKEYQMDKGLDVDGVWGIKCWQSVGK